MRLDTEPGRPYRPATWYRRCDVAKKAVSAGRSGFKKTAPKKKSTLKTSARKPHLPNEPVWQWSALQTAAAIRSGAISAVEVTQVHIARMRAVNPKLNAVVVDLSDE